VAAVSIIDQMTPAAVQHLNRNVSGYRFFPDLLSLNQHFMPGNPAVPTLITLGLAHLGAYNETTGELELDGPSRFAGKTFGIAYTYSHEFGHALDGPSHSFSNQVDWDVAWRAEIVRAFPGTNAVTSAQEGFSRFANLVYGGEVARADVETNFPLCVEFWRRQSLW